MHILNKFFDNVYVLNTDRRVDRRIKTDERLSKHDISYELYKGITGRSVQALWTELKTKPSSKNYWPTANTLACNISHLNIYAQALDRGEKRILILEDDLKVHNKVNELFTVRSQSMPDWDLLYLCYIPLSADRLYWDYSLITHMDISRSFFRALNIWSLMAYGISDNLMEHMLNNYNFDCEIDTYFVNFIQPNSSYNCIGVSPNLFCGDNLGSDNDPTTSNIDFTARTFDSRFSHFLDFN